MASLYFVTHTLVLSTQLPFKLYTFIYITNIVLLSPLLIFTSPIPIAQSNTKNYLPSVDPTITNLMVSHSVCEKQRKLRQFSLLNVK